MPRRLPTPCPTAPNAGVGFGTRRGQAQKTLEAGGARSGVWFFIRRYDRGFEVAITSDGLILRLPGFSDDPIPWSDIDGAPIKERPAGKPQVASVLLRGKNKTVEIGDVANVFPKRADAERFAQEVNERVGAPSGEAGSCPSTRNRCDGATSPRT